MGPVSSPDRVSQRALQALGHVSDLLTQPVLTVDVGETLWDAWQLMFVSGLHHLVVVKEGACIGVLTDRTLLADLPLTPEHLGRRRVREVMSGAVGPTLHQHDDVVLAASLLADQGVEAVPVVDHAGRILGIVTLADISARVARVAGQDH